MSGKADFEYVAEMLEQQTDLSRLEARGTVRIALKGAGYVPASISRDALAVVIDKVLPGELGSRGIADAVHVCERIRQGLIAQPESAEGVDTPAALFDRLIG